MKEKVYFPALDALRSIACLFVLLDHILWESIASYLQVTLPKTGYNFIIFFLGNGGMGVRIFFCLSGFLITYLILKEINKTGTINLKNFYIRRILRIWPVYFLVVFFVFIVYGGIKSLIGNNNPIHENPVLSVLFLSNYDLISILTTPGKYDNGMLALTWSVSVEEQFYLIWPIIFFISPKRYFKYYIGFVVLIAIIFCLYNSDNVAFIYHHAVSNFLFLGIGGGLAYFQIESPAYLKKKLSFSRINTVILIVSSLALLIFLKEPLYSIEDGIVVYWIYTAIFLFFILFLQVSDVSNPFNLSNAKYLVRVGKYTYGLYMYHRIAMFIGETIFYKFLHLKKNNSTEVGFVLFSFITTFTLSFLSYQLIEKRLLKYKDRFSHFQKKGGNLEVIRVQLKQKINLGA